MDSLKITALIENKAHGALKKEHGLSVFCEYGEKNICLIPERPIIIPKTQRLWVLTYLQWTSVFCRTVIMTTRADTDLFSF